MTPDRERRLKRMIGEICREIAVLVLVLSPLESAVTHGQLTVKGVLVTVLVALPTLLIGIWFGMEHDS
jgi:hypothetical protein